MGSFEPVMLLILYPIAIENARPLRISRTELAKVVSEHGLSLPLPLPFQRWPLTSSLFSALPHLRDQPKSPTSLVCSYP